MTTKLPKSWPTWLVKCSWRGTAIKLKVVAKDSDDAWDKASKLVKRMEGGMSCEDITVLGTI